MKIITTTVICWHDDGDVTCASDCRTSFDEDDYADAKAAAKAGALEAYADNVGPLQPRNRITTSVVEVPEPKDPEAVFLATLAEIGDSEPINVKVIE